MAAKSRTAKFYAANPEARKKRLEYQAEYNKRDDQKKYRAELNKANRDNGTYGNNDKKDVRHVNGKIKGTAHESINRGSKTDSAGDRRARGSKKQ